MDYFSVIPVERIDSVKTTLSQVFPDERVIDISLLSGGLSGSLVYKLTIGNRVYILKLNDPKDDVVEEKHASIAAAKAGIAPNMHFNNICTGISISDFIDNKPMHLVFNPESLAIELAKKLRAIHDIPYQTKGADIFVTIDEFINSVKDSNIYGIPVFKECLLYYDELKNKYPDIGSERVFCHNDLNPNNILCDGQKIWIIDWDAAYLNDRYLDLANMANYFVHTDENERAFLHAYFEEAPTDLQKARFHIMRQLSRMLYSVFMFKLAVQSKHIDFPHDTQMEGIDVQTFGNLMAAGHINLTQYEGWMMYGKALLNTAVHQMRLPRYATAITHF